ncbi:hypothetical protein ACIP10_29080 [Streptomyces galbus]|uniref:hypothetical protein n=1 Tax=Streptomyces galbus TaxID=33898 RepID=UPI00379F441B
MSGWWSCLEERTRREADEDVLRDAALGAVRISGGGRPPATAAAEAGRALADHLEVPFRFGSHTPDDEAPRRRDLRG